MSAPLRSEVSALQRLPSPFNQTTCHWCAEPADSEVPTRTGLRWACSRCAPYVRVKPTTQPIVVVRSIARWLRRRRIGAIGLTKRGSTTLRLAS